MDRDKYYSPPGASDGIGGSGYGRRVTSQAPPNTDRAEKIKKRSKQKEKRKRANNTKKKRTARIRALLAAAVLILAAVIILFLSPVLDIRNVTVSGNRILKTDELLNALQDIKGKNLILLSDGDAEDCLSDLSYVENATVSKFLIPPSVRVNITECKPAARVETNGIWLIIDPTLKILSDGAEFSDEHLPRAEGLSIGKYRVGKKLTLADKDEEKTEILELCLDTMISQKMIDRIDYIDITSTTNIRFGYDDRIDALCGSKIDLERKIRMFNVVVNGGNIAENARGTIDLSTSGKAKYTP